MKRLFALFLSILLLEVGAVANAEDWRSQLLDAFGLESDGEYGDTYWYGDSYDYDNYDYDDDEYDEPITSPQEIVNYLAAHDGLLPENFITKDEAKAMGWDSCQNYVSDVAPGMSIGGDRFGNYEGTLPDAKGRKWFECDTDYTGGKRGANRLVFSNDGLYYYTEDHYETFTQMFPDG